MAQGRFEKRVGVQKQNVVGDVGIGHCLEVRGLIVNESDHPVSFGLEMPAVLFVPASDLGDFLFRDSHAFEEGQDLILMEVELVDVEPLEITAAVRSVEGFQDMKGQIPQIEDGPVDVKKDDEGLVGKTAAGFFIVPGQGKVNF